MAKGVRVCVSKAVGSYGVRGEACQGVVDGGRRRGMRLLVVSG